MWYLTRASKLSLTIQYIITVREDNGDYRVYINVCADTCSFSPVYFLISETLREKADVCSAHITNSSRYSLSAISYYLIEF